MQLIVESGNMNDYLIETDEVDHSHFSIAEKANELSSSAKNEVEFVQAAFEYVRDQVFHSADIGSSRVTYKASDILQHKEGLCYAKSILLGAILRNKGIPAGFCYQKLAYGDTPDAGHALHGLNAVYLSTLNKWIRLDARGNKTGINAQFSIDKEQLAFPIRSHCGEIDYPTIYIHPNQNLITILKQAANGSELHLPSDIE
ncbi:transglutaminase family protein [Paenibacillus sp. NPDC058174]|uniref:transglutaminase-like domain-containing protein n=1 Tax=Paenibacillus sp. NPDC058174 TaxID=3346366 RepID=UPI0036DD448C